MAMSKATLSLISENFVSKKRETLNRMKSGIDVNNFSLALLTVNTFDVI